MLRTPDHDVLIVGAGPVGLLLAVLLTQAGRDVVVCERRAGPDERVRAIGIHRPGLGALDAAGLGDAVRRESFVLDGGEVRSRRRVIASLRFSDDRRVLILPQPRTDALLRERLRSLRPSGLRLSCEVTSLREHDDVVVARFGDGRPVSASVAVVADGVRSSLREALGFGWRARPGRASYVMMDAIAANDEQRLAVLHCEPEGLVECFPLPEGRRRWVVRLGDDTERLDRRSFCATVQQRTGIRVSGAEASPPSHFLASQHVARTLVRGRIALLGDAAREISPIGGQGMNLGWVDALRLAKAVLGAPSGAPDLGDYERGALAAAAVAQRRSAFYMGMGEPASGLRLLTRELTIGALASAPLRSWMSGMITMRGLDVG